VEPVFGGLNVLADQGNDLMVIANAAVIVCFEE
jgi:hypothetical protein